MLRVMSYPFSLSWQPCPGVAPTGQPCLLVPFWRSCSACLVLDVLFRLSSPGFPLRVCLYIYTLYIYFMYVCIYVCILIDTYMYIYTHINILYMSINKREGVRPGRHKCKQEDQKKRVLSSWSRDGEEWSWDWLFLFPACLCLFTWFRLIRYTLNCSLAHFMILPRWSAHSRFHDSVTLVCSLAHFMTLPW
jgi:hypothetical protein